jgi:glycosyltransferase involved in cell wall biosynthesis
MARRLRVLAFSTLFPNPRQPVHGVFVENRLRHLAASGEVDLRVVAPVAWRPSLAGVPGWEERHGTPVWHPRYPVIPKLGMTVAPGLMHLGVRRLVHRLVAEADIDLIDAHYFYPDGVAAALLGRELGKPVVITARGTDLNLIPRYALPRAQIRWAAHRAAACVTVCAALAKPLDQLGVPAERIRVLRNGVDLGLFRPGDRAGARRALGLDGPTLLSVGLLIERKGHHLVIDALAGLPGVTLLVAGSGPDRAALERRAAERGVAGRVRFLGEVAHERLPALYGAADALVLASSREGWANVLLEAMACGTPVVATDVWGTAEAVACPEAGVLVSERSAAAIAEGVRRLFAAPPERARTRRHAEAYGWEATTRGQLELFAAVAGGRG